MKKADRNYSELDLAFITGATENLRETAPHLSEQGYGVFQGTERQPESLQAMALSGDAQRQAEFVALIDKYEPQTKELADNMVTAGQLEPVRVRPTDEKGKYDLVFGARRTLARLYIHAKSGGKIPARLTAEIVEQDDKDALFAVRGVLTQRQLDSLPLLVYAEMEVFDPATSEWCGYGVETAEGCVGKNPPFDEIVAGEA